MSFQSFTKIFHVIFPTHALSLIVFGMAHSRPQRNHDLWPGSKLEVRDSRTSFHSAHAQSQVWQIWLVPVSFYCVCKAKQNRNITGSTQRSWSLVLTKRNAAFKDENGDGPPQKPIFSMPRPPNPTSPTLYLVKKWTIPYVSQRHR